MTSVRAVLLAIAAALLYAVSTPVSKLLLGRISPTMLAGLLYLGAGAGLMFLKAAITGKDEEGASLARDDMKFVVAMIVLDIAAPVLLLLGLGRTTAANVSLLNNFEIVMTSVIAFALFGERIPADVWCTGPGFRRLRTQHLVLYPCPAAHRRGAVNTSSFLETSSARISSTRLPLLGLRPSFPRSCRERTANRRFRTIS